MVNRSAKFSQSRHRGARVTAVGEAVERYECEIKTKVVLDIFDTESLAGRSNERHLELAWKRDTIRI